MIRVCELTMRGPLTGGPLKVSDEECCICVCACMYAYIYIYIHIYDANILMQYDITPQVRRRRGFPSSPELSRALREYGLWVVVVVVVVVVVMFILVTTLSISIILLLNYYYRRFPSFRTPPLESLSRYQWKKGHIWATQPLAKIF